MDFNGTFTQSLDALLQRVTPSLVVVRGHRWGAGAGIVWRDDGMILTNNHVVGRHAGERSVDAGLHGERDDPGDGERFGHQSSSRRGDDRGPDPDERPR